MMDAFECCKQHGGSVTAKVVEKLKLFTESEIIAEAVFLKSTIAPIIKLKQSWMKIVKFTARYLYRFW